MEISITKETSVKKYLEDIHTDISWAKISKKYFGKSPSWIYHKIDGIDGNGNPDGFTDNEREQFCGALLDLSERIRKAAHAI